VCDPISLTIAATTVMAVGQGVSAISSANQYRYEARVAKANTIYEDQRARDALERGRLDNTDYQHKLAQTMGQQNAALAANGIDPTFGSAAAVRADMAQAGRTDVNRINENALREAKGYEINAANYTAQAISDRRKASGALVEGAFGVASTVLGGATQVSKMQAGRKYGG
jgi:hypothetical protein